MSKKYCDIVEKDKLMYPDIVKVSNFPTNCPIKKVNFLTVNDVGGLKFMVVFIREIIG
jgi:superfamily I DNA/RNA helicase